MAFIIMLAKIKTKLFHDFSISLITNIFSYLVAFSGSIIYVRMLGKYEYGIYTFAFNIISLFLLVNGFGAASGVLQYVSQNISSELKDNYLRFAFYIGIIFNLIISIIIVIYALFANIPISDSRHVLLMMALFPVGRLYIDIYQAYLRATSQNILQARFSIINNLIIIVINVLGIYYYQLEGLVLSTYIAYLIMFIYSSYKFNIPSIFKGINLKHIESKKFISFSFFTTLSNAFSGLLFVLDIFIMSYIIRDPNLIATYKVATIIPFSINFIPGVIISYFYPRFVQASHSRLQIKKLARYVSFRVFIFSFMVSLGLIILAQPIIYIFFGTNYHDSILPFQILSFGYWIIASFRIVNGNIIAALGHAKLSFYSTLFILVVNIIVTYLMVLKYSIIGGAIAVVVIYIFSSIFNYITLQFLLNKIQD